VSPCGHGQYFLIARKEECGEYGKLHIGCADNKRYPCFT
jgi:hypothetical protein